ncbi:MAG TPA: hypothetical protein PLX83_11140 [bacterium]|nr:hypothetical protein [bacterium]
MGEPAYGFWIITGTIFLLVWLGGWWGWKACFRHARSPIRYRPDSGGNAGLSLQEQVDRAAMNPTGAPAEIQLGPGSFIMEDGLRITRPVHLQGNGGEVTRIAAEGDQPAITIQNVKNCSLSHLRIEGTIQCSNGEVRLRDCQIRARGNGICIEALDGSVVVFSGQIQGEGGIAIRAKGESKVVLQPPYNLSGDDYIVFDSQSRVSMEKRGGEPEPAQPV